MKIVRTKLVRILYDWVDAITLWPWIFVHPDVDQERMRELIPHEKIHLEQQKELLVVGFFILYGLFWLINRFIRYGGRNNIAYRKIPFEREAYDKEHVPDYAVKRDMYAWIKYIK